MEFFNKKQDVLDVQITPYGKQLLSRGLLKPAYYAFSDDGVIYDTEWVTGSLPEEQSSIETRIQENTPRHKTQYTKKAAEKMTFAINNVNYMSMFQNIYDLFEFANYQDLVDHVEEVTMVLDSAEDEKLLENTLGMKTPFDQYNPAWNLLFYHGQISGSTSYLTNNGIIKHIPQLNCTMRDIAYKFPAQIAGEKKWEDTIAAVNNITSKFEDNAVELEDFFESLALPNGEQIFILKDFLFLSAEETSVEYLNDNFELEIFEVMEQEINGEKVETWNKMVFSDTGATDTGYQVADIFSIQVDAEVDNEVACYLIGKDMPLKEKNIYLTKIYDCATPSDDSLVTADPYIDLPKTNVEDVC